MHALAEIVIPPTGDVPAAVAQVMDHFREDKYDADGNETGEKGGCDWWDWWKIGGRYSGAKVEAVIGEERLKAFTELLQAKGVTVSGFRAGKPDLQPAGQQGVVDSLWREWFPGMGDRCLLFNHARDQYRKDGYYPDDVCRVDAVPDGLTCERLIVAGPHWREAGRLEAKRMLAGEFWNGVEWQTTTFDGRVKAALAAMRADDRRRVEVADDWLVVSVDYHN